MSITSKNKGFIFVVITALLLSGCTAMGIGGGMRVVNSGHAGLGDFDAAGNPH